jgi:hypothetical protein
MKLIMCLPDTILGSTTKSSSGGMGKVKSGIRCQCRKHYKMAMRYKLALPQNTCSLFGLNVHEIKRQFCNRETILYVHEKRHY